jgi:hypothetical protein
MKSILKQTEELKKLQERNLSDALKDLSEVTDPKMRSFLSKSIRDAQKGNLSINDFMNKFKELHNANRSDNNEKGV